MAEVPRWYEAVTETPVVALHAPVEGLIDVFEDNFEMAMDYLAVFARLVAPSAIVVGRPSEDAPPPTRETRRPGAQERNPA